MHAKRENSDSWGHPPTVLKTNMSVTTHKECLFSFLFTTSQSKPTKPKSLVIKPHFHFKYLWVFDKEYTV